MNSFKSRRVFLSTPSGMQFEALRHQLRETLTQFGWETVSYGMFASSPGHPSRIGETLLQSSCMIADITGSNPNVIYEAGLARGAGIPVLFITQNLGISTPSFLQENLFLIYQPDNLAPTLSRIAGWLQNQVSQSGSWQ